MLMSITPLSLGSDPSRAKRAEQAGPWKITHAPTGAAMDPTSSGRL